MPGRSSTPWSHNEREVQSASGHWYLMRILPYRTQKNAIAGVVITFVEITRQKAMQQNYNNCSSKSKPTPMPGALWRPSANRCWCWMPSCACCPPTVRFTDSFHVSKEETIGNSSYDLGNGQWNIPELRTLLEEILPGQTVITDYTMRAHL